jgi:hypothetical protein
VNRCVQELLNEKIIGLEDVTVAKFILLLLINGAGRRRLIEKTLRDERVGVWWKNLEDSYFISDDKVFIERKYLVGCLVIMILVAEGKIRREIEE